MGARRRKTTKNASSRKKKMPLKKRMMIILVAIVAFIALVVLFAYYGTLNYLQADSFRQRMEDSVANLTQSDYVEIAKPLTIDQDHVLLSGISLGRKDAVQNVSVKSVDAQLNTSQLYHQHLHVPSLEIGQLKLELDLSRMGKALPALRKLEGGFFAPFLPRTLQLDHVNTANLSCYLRYQDEDYALTGFSLDAEPLQKGQLKAWNIDLENGWITTPFELVNKCKVERARVTVQEDGYLLDDCRIMLSPGDIELNAVYSNKSQSWSANIQSNKANVGALLTDSWKSKLHGQLYSKLKLNGNLKGISSLNGELRLKNAVAEALPFLSDYQDDHTYPYRNVHFDKAQCKLFYPYVEAGLAIRDAWLFDEIDVESKDKIRIEGHVIIGSDRTLAGSLQVGIPTIVVQTLAMGDEGSLGKIFNGGVRGSYTWLSINLSGTLDDPQQDLSIRLSSMAKAAALKGADDALNGIFSLFGSTGVTEQKRQTNPTSQDSLQARPQTKEESKSIFDMGSDAAKGVLESLF